MKKLVLLMMVFVLAAGPGVMPAHAREGNTTSFGRVIHSSASQLITA